FALRLRPLSASITSSLIRADLLGMGSCSRRSSSRALRNSLVKGVSYLRGSTLGMQAPSPVCSQPWIPPRHLQGSAADDPIFLGVSALLWPKIERAHR